MKQKTLMHRSDAGQVETSEGRIIYIQYTHVYLTKTHIGCIIKLQRFPVYHMWRIIGACNLRSCVNM